MARKRLNKKLVLILLSAIGCIFVIGIVGFVQYRYRDPQPFLDEACRQAVEVARITAENEAEVASITDPRDRHEKLQELNEEKLADLQKESLQNFGYAYRFAQRTNKKELCREAALGQAKLFQKMGEHASAYAVWRRMLETDPADVDALRCILEFDYEMADYFAGLRGELPAGVRTAAREAWTNVRDTAIDFIQQEPESAWGYAVQAHAVIGLAGVGEPAGRAEQFEVARELLGRSRESDPDYLLGYHVRAQLVMQEARLAEDPNVQASGYDLMERIYREAIQAHPDEPEAYYLFIREWGLGRLVVPVRQIDSLRQQLRQLANSVEAVRQRVQEQLNDAEQHLRDAHEIVAGEIQTALSKFPHDGRFNYLDFESSFITGITLGNLDTVSDYDPLIQKLRTALSHENARTAWQVRLSLLYQNVAHYKEDRVADLRTAYDLLREALYQPGATELQSSHRNEVRQNRLRILQTLAQVTGFLLHDDKGPARQESYRDVGQEIATLIADTFGSDSIQARQARGILAWGDGDSREAVRLLYGALQELEAVNQTDSFLNLMLFYAMKEAGDQTQAGFQGIRALNGGYFAPPIFRDVMQTLSGIVNQDVMRGLVQLTEEYEQRFGLNGPEGDRVLLFRIGALITLKNMTGADATTDIHQRAQAALDRIQDKSLPEVQMWSTLLPDTIEKRISALQLLAKVHVDDERFIALLYQVSLSQAAEHPDYLKVLREIIDGAVAAKPDSTNLRQMQETLKSENPLDLSDEDVKRIIVSLRALYDDPADQALFEGQQYRSLAQRQAGRDDEAASRQSLQQAQAAFERAASASPDRLECWAQLMGVMLLQRDFAAAQDVIDRVRPNNENHALQLQADLAQAQQNWEELASVVERFLPQEPTSVNGHLLLAQAYENLGRFTEALQAARQAQRLDPTSVNATRLLAILRHQNMLRSGDEPTDAQVVEMFALIQRLLQSNSQDSAALGLAVNYLPRFLRIQARRGSSPDQTAQEHDDNLLPLFQNAVALGRRLVDRHPDDAKNWVALAHLYTELAQILVQPQLQQDWKEQADAVYKEARARNPESPELVAAHSQYLSDMGKTEAGVEELKALVASSTGSQQQNARLSLIQLYRQQGQNDLAKSAVTELVRDYPDFDSARAILVDVLLREEDFEGALKELDILLEHQDNVDLLARRAELLIVLQRSDEAEAFLQKSMERHPEHASLQIAAAKLEMIRANYNEAIRLADAIIAAHPDVAEAYTLKARCLAFDRQNLRALECLEALRTVIGDRSNAGRVLAAQIYYTEGRVVEAIGELRAALQLEPADAEARRWLMRYLRDQGRWEDLLLEYRTIIEQNPNSPNGYLGAALAWMQYAESILAEGQPNRAAPLYQNARAMIEKTLEICLATGKTEVYDTAYDTLLQLWLKVNQPQEVLRLTEQETRDRPDQTYLLLRRAQALFKLSRQDEALDLLERLLTLTDDQPSAQLQILNSLGSITSMDEAERWAQAKLNERPDWVALYYVLATVYQARGDAARQQVYYEKALSYARYPSLQVDLKSKLAILHSLSGRNDLAIDLYRDMLKNQLAEPSALRGNILNNLAYLLMEQEGREDEAVAMAEEAYRLSGGASEIMDTYAVALMKKKRFDEAQSILLQAVQARQRKGDQVAAEFYLHLAQAYFGSGQTLAAGDYLRSARSQFDRKQIISEAGTVAAELDIMERQLSEANTGN